MNTGNEAARSQAGRTKMLTLPNLLTLSRIVAVPLLVALLWRAKPIHYFEALALYSVVAVTDYLDGYLARAQGSVSKLGIFLDPIADKIMVCALIVLLTGTGDIAGSSIFAAIIILVREIAVSGLREFLGGLQVSLPVSKIAKIKTACQMIGLGGIILSGGLPGIVELKTVSLGLFWVAALLTIYTGWDYLRVGLKHMD